jgi:hypothetical protein
MKNRLAPKFFFERDAVEWKLLVSLRQKNGRRNKIFPGRRVRIGRLPGGCADHGVVQKAQIGIETLPLAAQGIVELKNVNSIVPYRYFV